jgi:hypothetical protein
MEIMKLFRTAVALGAAAIFVFGMVYLATVAQGQDAKDTSAKAAETKAPAKAVDHAYVGIAKCKMCHNAPAKGAMFDVWSKTKHAAAFTNLPAEGQKNPKCFACHATGFGKTGGFDPADAKTDGLKGVVCEACHGPGKDYIAMPVMKDKAKAKDAGLVTVDAAVCKVCHEGAVPEGHKERPKFDFAAAYKLIEHHPAPPAPAK